MKVEFELSEHRVLVAAACGFVGLFALHAAYPGLFKFWPKTSSELADWFAAFGAIAAIFGSFWLATLQEKRRIASEKEDAVKNFQLYAVSVTTYLEELIKIQKHEIWNISTISAALENSSTMAATIPFARLSPEDGALLIAVRTTAVQIVEVIKKTCDGVLDENPERAISPRNEAWLKEAFIKIHKKFRNSIEMVKSARDKNKK